MKKSTILLRTSLACILLLSTVCSTVLHAQAFPDETLDVAAVPVNLTSFTGNKINNTIQLMWVTASELNNSHFNVQRSSNGVDFKNIARVVGKGTSTSINHYLFNDVVDQTTNLYYRLQQVDLDGKSTNSSIVLIKFGKDGTMQVSIFPNPLIGSSLTISLQDAPVGKYFLAVRDIVGKIVCSKSFDQLGTSGTCILELPVGTSKGVYLVLMSNINGETIVSKQLVVQ